MAFDIIPIIVEFNNLACDTCIQPGQVIEVPLPTPTLNPEAFNEVSGVSNQSDISSDVALTSNEVAEVSEVSAEDSIATRNAARQPTLDPNLQFHVVTQGQTLYDVIAIYNIDVKLLSEINPEIEFANCEFGETFGGPDCTVFFAEGQQVRVPAPTPTPTIRPTSDGSETPTPTFTPTINVPTILSPQEGAEFDAARIVTLRWTTTGTLGGGRSLCDTNAPLGCRFRICWIDLRPSI